MQLNLEQAFPTEQALRDMIVMRKVCFDHDPFYVKTGAGNVVQIGFQLNLYAAFRDPTQLPLNDDAEHREILGDLQRLCRVFFQTLDLLKPCEHPQPPAHRIVFSPERKNRAEAVSRSRSSTWRIMPTARLARCRIFLRRRNVC
ncbi:MAG TPA: hypothetical protein PK224_17310 [Nitrospira sp.]|nr:hypothetical protein [Nitrospira sp.]